MTQHWHGLFQTGTNEMDGVAWVTQCPIIPDQSFLYVLTSPVVYVDIPLKEILATTSPSRTKQELFGIIPIFLPNIVTAFGTV